MRWIIQVLSIFIFFTFPRIILILFLFFLLLLSQLFEKLFFLRFLFICLSLKFHLCLSISKKHIFILFLTHRSASFCKEFNDCWPVKRFGGYLFLHSIKNLLECFSRNFWHSFWLSCDCCQNSFDLRIFSNFYKEIKYTDLIILIFESWARIKNILNQF